MWTTYTGEIAALLTALFWSVTSLSFEAAGKRIGSLVVNLLRLAFAMVIYSVFLWIKRGMALPFDATPEAWSWLALSGLVGFAVGDLLLFQAFVVIGARLSMLLMALVPPITALIGWGVMGEVMTPLELFGMAVTVTGVSMVVLKKEAGERGVRKMKYPLNGILLGLGGAVGQALGLVLSKFGMKDYDPFAASQIRVMAGLAGFILIFLVMRKGPSVQRAFSDKKGIGFTALGSVFGPFLGVSFSLLAIQHTHTGVAATIMSIVPVLLIPPAILIFHEKVTWREVFGSFVAVAGVSVMFLIA
ncbi:MAG: DMT family transporter [Bacteroidales bacterium]